MKKPTLISILLVIFCLIFAAITLQPNSKKIDTTDESSELIKNQPPQATITTQNINRPQITQSSLTPDLTIYTNEELILHAIESYDPDGTIKDYRWILEDDSIITSTTLKKTYNEPGDIQVILQLTDNDNATTYQRYLIHIETSQRTLFLENKTLTNQPTTTKTDVFVSAKIRALEKNILTYTFEQNYNLPPTNYSITLSFSKPLLTILTKTTITLYNTENQQIGQSIQRHPNIFWKNKQFNYNGALNEQEVLSHLSITFTGFSLKSSIELNESDSLIEFTFL